MHACLGQTHLSSKITSTVPASSADQQIQNIDNFEILTNTMLCFVYFVYKTNPWPPLDETHHQSHPTQPARLIPISVSPPMQPVVSLSPLLLFLPDLDREHVTRQGTIRKVYGFSRKKVPYTEPHISPPPQKNHDCDLRDTDTVPTDKLSRRLGEHPFLLHSTCSPTYIKSRESYENPTEDNP